jgi:uncharacterized damage-inducible protein DinB
MDETMRDIIHAVREEFLRYKALAEAAIAQLSDAELCDPRSANGNSIAVICWHVSGNLRSRFTDFLTADGEKPWRQRDEEFDPRAVTKAELLAKWQQGWDVLVSTLGTLSDSNLGGTVTIRGQAMRVHEALLRALAHVASHVGQIVLLGKAARGGEWRYLSIAPGQSAAYNQNPTGERAASHARSLADRVESAKRP